MCRQHFTVSVNVHTGAFCLLQQHMQIFEVMTGDQNRFTCHRTDVHGRWRRVTVSFGFTGIQHFHDFKVHHTNRHRLVEQLTHIRRISTEPRHDFMVLAVNLITVFAQHMGVLHICRRPFQAVQAEHTQTVDIITDSLLIFIQGKFIRLFHQ